MLTTSGKVVEINVLFSIGSSRNNLQFKPKIIQIEVAIRKKINFEICTIVDHSVVSLNFVLTFADNPLFLAVQYLAATYYHKRQLLGYSLQNLSRTRFLFEMVNAPFRDS